MIEYFLLPVTLIYNLFGAHYAYPRFMIRIYGNITLLSVFAIPASIFSSGELITFARHYRNFISPLNGSISIRDYVYFLR